MIQREIETQINTYLESEPENTLVVIGPRQVGKTTTIRHCLQQHDKPVIELSFKKDPKLKSIFTAYQNSEELLLRISIYVCNKLTEEKLVFFFDDVEECPEALDGLGDLTKQLRGQYYCIIAGTPRSLEIRNLQQRYENEFEFLQMYPICFREFCIVNGITERVCSYLEMSCKQRTDIDDFVHQRMMELFHKYLVVGGMPEAVNQFLEDEDYEKITRIHLKIIEAIQQDLKVLDPKDKRYMLKIFSLIPKELSKHNKRYILKNLGENFKFCRQKSSFRDTIYSGSIYSAFCVDEPVEALEDRKSENLFKLYMPDVGLLTSLYSDNTQEKLLNGEVIQNGAICENAIAQELIHNGHNLYYYSSHQNGEIDFLVPTAKGLIPVLIKSGKNYQRHNGMYSLMHSGKYSFSHGLVLGDANVSAHDNELRLPIYMIGFVKDHN